ncbi:hypothetical protein KXD40_008736 [Peronospora effusa]|uniref:Uncharacterized protein n=1 Tax=Peronospora effusa TaxID=542832 RepID=A0A3M6VS82_9STRA|nr:hypothetical protein DD238_006343 [Peronospora effusa]RQM18811.1 hypothetical protein DD237_007451 [Peronospora effusa]UIZ22069.1 hypothetical protein KXD40_008736 [Peronospora effusa]
MSLQELCEKVLDHLIEKERGQQKARDLFLQSAPNVKQALTSLLSLERVQQRVSSEAILTFVESLPQPDWIIFACDVMLRGSGLWDKCAIAVLLRKVMSRSTGKTLMLAESCWIQRLDFGVRAIASSATVTIASTVGDNRLYVAGDGYAHDKNNRSVYCWKGPWTADNKKELWRFVPASTGSSDFYIMNVYADAYLYVSSSSVTTENDDCLVKRVLMPRYEKGLPDAAGIWRLVKLEGKNYSIYNASTDTVLSSPMEASDGSRRDAVTRTYRPLDEMSLPCHEWKITSATPSKMEKGLVELYAERYNKAVKAFTEILTMDHLSVVHRTKLLCYRMVANVMMNNIGCFEQDWAEVLDLGGGSDDVLATLCEGLPSDTSKILEERVQLIHIRWKKMKE